MRNSASFINTCYPVTQMEIYKNGCYKLKRRSMLQGDYSPRERGKIKMLTKKSLLNLIWTINATDITFNSMITLTYPNAFPVNGPTVKEDLRVFLQWYKRRFGGDYLWFLEFQKRGAPHFHILSEVSELTPTMRVDLGLYWTKRIADSPWFLSCFRYAGAEYANGEIDWQHYKIEVLKVAKFNVHEQVWQLAKHKNGMRNYAAKYASKEYQKEVPSNFTEVGRFWGASKGVRPDVRQVIDVTEDEVRQWLEKKGHNGSSWDVLPKVIFNAK